MHCLVLDKGTTEGRKEQSCGVKQRGQTAGSGLRFTQTRKKKGLTLIVGVRPSLYLDTKKEGLTPMARDRWGQAFVYCD